MLCVLGRLAMKSFEFVHCLPSSEMMVSEVKREGITSIVSQLVNVMNWRILDTPWWRTIISFNWVKAVNVGEGSPSSYDCERKDMTVWWNENIAYCIIYKVIVEDVQVFNIRHISYDSQEIRSGQFMASSQGEPLEKAEGWSQGYDSSRFHFRSILRNIWFI